MMFDRRLLENFDWFFFGVVLTLACVGIINLYSAAMAFKTGSAPIYMKQIYWALIGLGIVLVVICFDYHLLISPTYLLYALGLLLLIAVLVAGRKTSGAQRWLDLGFMSFQPSEFMKIITLITLAKFFSRREYPHGLGFKELIVPAIIVGTPFLLILIQPDLGTSLHLAFSCLAVLVFLRVRKYVIVTLFLGLASAMPFAWHFLKEYQKQRIVTFLNPEGDPLGAGYHIIQSKIAVGSGMTWGKGFLKGTQSQLRFLPEQHTDFAFSAFAEEWGFIGTLVLLALFFLLIILGLRVIRRSQDRFGALLGLGLISLLFFQFLINISMVTGLMPVVGIPMPFISYGGTSLLTTMTAVGLILNIGMRRYAFRE